MRLLSCIKDRRLPYRYRWLSYGSIWSPLQTTKLTVATFRRDDCRCKNLVLKIRGTKFLRDSVEVSRALNMKLFLAFGTLLGYHRERGWLDGDGDVDVGLLDQDYRRRDEFIHGMRHRGYDVVRDSKYDLLLSKAGQPEFYIDIHRYYEKSRKVAASLDDPSLE